MITTHSEYNRFYIPAVFSSELLPRQDLLDDCSPFMSNIATAGLSAIAYDARENSKLLYVPILGDGVRDVLDREFRCEAANTPRTTYAENAYPLALSGAIMLAAAVATSKLLAHPNAIHDSYVVKGQFGEQIALHQAELSAANQQIRLDYKCGRYPVYIQKVAVRFEDSKENATLQFGAATNPGEFYGDNHFANIYVAKHPANRSINASVQVGDSSGMFGRVHSYDGFNRIAAFSQLIARFVTA